MTTSSGSSAGRAAPPQDPYDFSVVLGGPLYQIFRRVHLSGGGLELMHRRVVVITLFAWLPLLLLSFLDGHLWSSAVKVPFTKETVLQLAVITLLPVVPLTLTMISLDELMKTLLQVVR